MTELLQPGDEAEVFDYHDDPFYNGVTVRLVRKDGPIWWICTVLHEKSDYENYPDYHVEEGEELYLMAKNLRPRWTDTGTAPGVDVW